MIESTQAASSTATVRRLVTLIVLVLCLGFQPASVHSVGSVSAQVAITNAGVWHTVGTSVPTSLGFPVTREGKPGTLNKDCYLDSMTIANTDTVAHTITVQDNQGTPVPIFNAYTIAAGTTWAQPFPGILMAGGIKWQSNSTTVKGWLTGH